MNKNILEGISGKGLMAVITAMVLGIRMVWQRLGSPGKILNRP